LNEEREIYRRIRSGEQQKALASVYKVHPSKILIQKVENFELNRPSGTATSVPAYVCRDPPNVFQNAMQSNADYALVPSPQQG
jgi:hypothetical protein